MDPARSEEEGLLRDALRRFLDGEAPVTPWVRARWDEGGTTDAVWRGTTSLGLPGLLVPAPHGGVGASFALWGAALEELGRALHPGPLFATAVATAWLRALDDPAAWSAHGPAIARGACRVAVALDAPDAPRLRARREGDAFRLSGEVSPVLSLAQADALFVPARVGQGDALGLFRVAPDDPVLARERLGSVDGTRPLHRVRLANAPARRIGTRDATAAAAVAGAAAAAGLVADGVGAAGRVLELAVEHARSRVQFGRPIGSFQAVQHRLVDMLRDVELARAAGSWALQAIDHEPPDERDEAVAVAKAFASERLPAVGAGAIQVLGGVGCTWEIDAHLYYRRLIALSLLCGDAGAWLERLARLRVDP